MGSYNDEAIFALEAAYIDIDFLEFYMVYVGAPAQLKLSCAQRVIQALTSIRLWPLISRLTLSRILWLPDKERCREKVAKVALVVA